MNHSQSGRYSFTKSDINLYFCSINVKGQQNEIKRKKQYQLTKTMDVDILFLQETHSVKETESIWRNQYGGEHSFYCHGDTNARGVSVHLRKGLNAKIIETISDQDGRSLWVKAEIQGQKFGLLNIYAPNSEKDQVRFFEGVRIFLNTNYSKDTKIIIGGDFNVVRNASKDKLGGNCKRKSKAAEKIEQILCELHLLDVWRAKNRYSRQYTWSQQKPKVFCRLDMWLIPNELLQIVKSSQIVPAIETDHRAITFQITGEQFAPRGPGYWKLNTSVLQEAEYQKMIKEAVREYHEYAKTTDIDPRYQWEELKGIIKEKSIDYCKKRANNRRKKEKEMLLRIKKLEDKLHLLEDEVLEEYQELKAEFEQIYDEKIKGQIMRSRARWIAQGERNTKYFYGLEKRNYSNQSITQLQREDGKIIEKPEEILNEIFGYFNNQFSFSPTDLNAEECERLFQELPQITKRENKDLGEPITTEECEIAMKQMVEGKSPGEDGIPVEFYKTFWSLIKEDLMRAYTTSLEEGEVYCSQARGMIRLVPKPLKNLLF